MSRKTVKESKEIIESDDENEILSESEISESETETKPIEKTTKPRKNRTIEQRIETIEIEPKPKPKRIMSEKQKENLKYARKCARAKLAEKRELSQKIKDMKKERHLIQKLEMECKLAEHADYKKRLMIKAGLVELPKEEQKEEPKERKVRSDKNKKHCEPEPDTDSEDEREILALNEKLEKLKMKNKKIKKKIEIKKEESESEGEEDDPLLRAKPKHPEIKKHPATITDSERYRPNVRKSNDKDIDAQIKLLFPKYGN